MKILFLSDNFPPEGNAPATRTWEHTRRWAASGHDVTVVTGAPNFPEGRVHDGYSNDWHSVETLDGVRIVRVKTFISANEGTIKRILDYTSFMCSATLFSLFEERPDIIVATSPQFFTSIAGWTLSKLRRRPYVFEVRDLWPASIIAVGAMHQNVGLQLLEKLELFLYRQAKVVVAVTESFRDDLAKRGIDASKVHVIFNGVGADLKPIGPDHDLENELGLQGKFVVAYVGTHGMAHSLETVLEAASQLRNSSDIHFLFVGSGAAKERATEHAQTLGLNNVTFVDRRPREDLPKIWSLCDVGLIPLRDTPVFSTVIPSKLFEIAALGIPSVMAVPEGEATSILRAAEAGLVVPPEDPAALAGAISQLHQDHSLRQRLSENAKKLAKKFSRDELAARMLDVLLQAATKG